MKKVTLFLSAMLFSLMSFAQGVMFTQTFPGNPSEYTSAYSKSFTVTTDGYTLTYANINNGQEKDAWTAVRAGSKNGESVATITSNKITGTVSKVVINFTEVNADKTNALYLEVASTSDFADAEKVEATIATGEVEFAVASPAENMYYRVSIDQAKGSANGFNRFDKVVFYGEGGETPEQPEEPVDPETPDTPDTPTEPELPEVPEGAITCAQALEICQATGETATAEEYTIQGYVTSIKDAWNEQFGNISFWMADAVDGGQVLQAYRVKPVNAEEKNVKVGDFVEVVGTLVNYKGNTPEVNAGGQYTILVAGETPEQPEEPETPDTPDTPVVGGLDGYTKVTNAASLVEGDKVVLYCDASQVGITGWDGNKTATAAASGWVQYVVELTDGGFLLKDGDQYIALTVKNTFSYNATGSVCQVTADGILYIHLESEGKDFLLYENLNNGNTIYRMYVDKAGNKQYNPVYVYKLGEGGETPDTPVDPEQPETPDTPDTPTEPELPEVPEGAITCAQALEICVATGETSTAEEYTIQGYVTSIKDAWNDQYGNISFWMADAVDGGQVLQAYRVKPVNAEEKNVKVGDFVEVVGTLVNYKGNTPEVNAGGQYTILVAGETPDTPIEPEQPSVETVGDGTEANPFTIEDVIALNNTLSGKHYVKAYIVGQAVGQSFVDGLDMEAPFEAAAEATQGTNLAVASTLNPAVENIIPVQLPKGEWRDAFNLVENPDKLGIQVIICGSLEKYFGLPGIKSVTSIVEVSADATGLENTTVNGETATKVIRNGQLMIILGENVYNAIGVQVK